MSGKKLGQDPAFAKQTLPKYGQQGMSKRFYAACAAMQGLVSANEFGVAHDPQTVAKWSYAIADELLKQEML